MTKIDELLDLDLVKTCILLSPSGFPTAPHGKLITFNEISERLRLKIWNNPSQYEELTLPGDCEVLAFAQGPNRQGVRTIEIGGKLFRGNVLIQARECGTVRDLSEEEIVRIQKLCCDFAISQKAGHRLLESRIGVYIAVAVLDPGTNEKPRGRALMISNDLESFYDALGSTLLNHSYFQLRSRKWLHAFSASEEGRAKSFLFQGKRYFGRTLFLKRGALCGADSFSEKDFEEIARECESFAGFDEAWRNL